MKNATLFWSVAMLVSLSSGATAGEHANRSGHAFDLAVMARVGALPQAAKAPAWKSRGEYDAFNAMATEGDPNNKIALAESFLQKYGNSDFKALAYQVEMQTYQQLNQTDKAVEAARKAVEADPNNLPPLRFLSFTFPFLYKADDADSAAKLAHADSDAHHGLDVLGQLQRPAGATDAQFQQGVKEFRSMFNSCIGFVALQKKDYPAAITALKAATDDNPSGWYALYWLGLSYLYSTPRDYDHAIWYDARAVDLAKAGKDPNADAWEKYVKQIYVGYHGTDVGLSDIMTQAAASANPPDGFKVVSTLAGPQVNTPPVPPSGPTSSKTKEPGKKLGPKTTHLEPSCRKGALREFQVLELLEGSVAPERVTMLVQERGVCFDLTPDLAVVLKEKGATDELLVAIHKAEGAQE